MTPPASRLHPARERLESAGRKWPGIWTIVDEAREKLAAAWPPHVFLTLPAASAVLTEWKRRQGVEREHGGAIGEQGQDAAELAALAAWRMGQGVFRFDPALQAALALTPITRELPAFLLQRLPQWGVYIECDLAGSAAASAAAPVRGFWAWLDRGVRGAAIDMLWIAWDLAGVEALQVTAVPLVGSLADGVEAAARQWREAQAAGAVDDAAPAGRWQALFERLPAALSLVLYLCAADADLACRAQPAQPANPVPKKTRREGLRLFAADGVTPWDVGGRVGAGLQPGPGQWLSTATGPRLHEDGTPIAPAQRERDLRWVPPGPAATAA
jgi:hypothetical protein